MKASNPSKPINLDIEHWIELAQKSNLDFSIIDPNNLGIDLPIDKLFCFKGYGAKNGMIVIPNGISVIRFHEKILELEYGYSVVSPPDNQGPAHEIKDLLSDWGKPISNFR